MRFVRRLAYAVIGVFLLVVTGAEAYVNSSGLYKEHIVWPIEKGVAIPFRWQDKLFFVGFWIAAAALLYLSFRLITYGLRGRRKINSGQAALY